MTDRDPLYRRHRFPAEIIAHAVWLYFRFPLSLRLVEEMLLERGIAVSYETIRRWALKYGRDYARRLRHKAPSRRDIWHLDEVVITIAGETHWLWRAVGQDGYVLDEHYFNHPLARFDRRYDGSTRLAELELELDPRPSVNGFAMGSTGLEDIPL